MHASLAQKCHYCNESSSCTFRVYTSQTRFVRACLLCYEAHGAATTRANRQFVIPFEPLPLPAVAVKFAALLDDVQHEVRVAFR